MSLRDGEFSNWGIMVIVNENEWTVDKENEAFEVTEQMAEELSYLLADIGNGWRAEISV